MTSRSRLLFCLGWALVAADALGHESTLHVLLAQATPPAATAPLGPTGPLTIDLVLEPGGERVPGLVRITDVASGRVVDLPAHLRRPMGWHSLAAGATVDVPARELKIEACHGLQTEIATVTQVVTSGGGPNRVRLALRRFHETRDLVGANTHLHLMLNNPRVMGDALLRSRREAEDYLRAIAGSDALDLVYVSHLERTGETPTYVSNEFTRHDLARFSSDRVHFVNGEEHRHEGGRSPSRFGPERLSYGHVMFLDLPRLVQPVSYGAIFMPGVAASDAVPMRRAIDEARGLDATIVWCHGRQGTEHVPNWLASRLDAQNIFDSSRDTGFDDAFYVYLNAGLRVPFSTGTDWGCYDFSRVYVTLKGPVSSRTFREALVAGRSFITNGPLLQFDVAGGLAPGDTLALPQSGDVRIRARAIGRDEFGQMEVVFNGRVVGQAASSRQSGHFKAELDRVFAVREPGWFALRVAPTRIYGDRTQYTGAGANLFGKALFAHTSAVYVTIEGKSVRQSDAVRLLIADVEASIRTIEAKGAFASDAERDGLLAIYREAIRALEARLK